MDSRRYCPSITSPGDTINKRSPLLRNTCDFAASASNWPTKPNGNGGAVGGAGRTAGGGGAGGAGGGSHDETVNGSLAESGDRGARHSASLSRAVICATALAPVSPAVGSGACVGAAADGAA